MSLRYVAVVGQCAVVVRCQGSVVVPRIGHTQESLQRGVSAVRLGSLWPSRKDHAKLSGSNYQRMA